MSIPLTTSTSTPSPISTPPSIPSSTPSSTAPSSPSPRIKMNIRVREATIKDLNRVADISSQAFLHNALFDNLNPRRHEYYESFRYTRLRHARNAMLKPSMRLLVAENDDGEVVGYAMWERLGNDAIAQKVKAERDGILLRLERFLVNVTDRINAVIAPDPSADPVAATRLRIASNTLEKLHWDTAERKTRWHLHWLGVDPAQQRKGIGRHLVQWGLDRAIEDKVWAGIESSAVGEKLYSSMGFKVIGERLPCIEGINMGTVMAWEPKRS
ncbi:uncharacterized protein H6S33_012167 [Morchella sextelata]|uniref:uncharacterized protein n=1 Tax=Morchella sextelata TaxID=1174677 RepID=UPI001D04097F|nr:uncharacterized protein H6S33_012167 [Morchella sextelata]KAH0610640.1 hypothetical protein H6S33_012167 [Morchella sextelata]